VRGRILKGWGSGEGGPRLEEIGRKNSIWKSGRVQSKVEVAERGKGMTIPLVSPDVLDGKGERSF